MVKVWIETRKTKIEEDYGDPKLAVGKSLWSPQKSPAQRRLWENMKKVEPDDIIIHMIENNFFYGMSKAESNLKTDFICPKGSNWGNQKGYFISLKEFVQLKKPIDKNDLLREEKYSEKLIQIRKKNTVFYTKALNIRESHYLTEIPQELFFILNQLNQEKNGKNLPYQIQAPKQESTESPLEINTLLEKKKQIILYGPPGTGKTYATKKIAQNLIGEQNDS